MAPKRKNKKPAGNPARGFATTSTASKAQASREIAAEQNASESLPEQQDAPENLGGRVISVEKELHQLSPEELEKQLDVSDLNLFLEKHGEKVKRDVTRQVNKLQTEKRLYRAQAELLPTRSWLPQDMMQLIIEAIESEQSSESQSHELNGSTRHGDLSGEDLTLKLWALNQVLIQLGFPYEHCQESLRYVLYVVQDTKTAKDSIWGLDCCLSWLALHCDPQQMPSYLSQERKTQAIPLLEPRLENDSMFGDPDSEPVSTSSVTSRPSSPSSQPNRNGRDVSPYTNATPASTNSDTGSDVDPDTMTERYIDLQTQLYELEPDRDIVPGSQRTSHAKSAPKGSLTQDSQQRLAKILRRLERLKADILFDGYDADQKWAEKRNQLAKAAAQRRKLQLDDRNKLDTASSDQRESDTATVGPVGETRNASEEDQDAEALGDFFSGLPDTASTIDGGANSPITKDSLSRPLIVRDFGKWNGMSPRRILEDACRARDSSARVTYRRIDRSPFAKQHSVNIYWSSTQPPPLPSPIEAVSCSADARRVQIEMRSEAVPDSMQSEAYVSTAALFLIFSSIPKEEKAMLRLPSVWKDLWSEFGQSKKECDLAADRDELRKVRDLVESAPPRVDKNLPVRQVAPSVNPALSTTSFPLETPGQQQGSMRREEMKAIWSSKSATPSFKSMLEKRKMLPIWGFKDDILQRINDHPVIIVCGETGCGKSTQVPSYILEHELSCGRGCKIYCTEPRRISAISLARRVSEELGERKSDVGTSRSLVGYAIRLENKSVRGTRLIYATTGIVMRMLESTDDIGEITHLVLDEVHERSIESDFLLIILRKLLIRRPTLKVVLMSATVDAAKFSAYFDGAPILTVPGRTFPVQVRYLEDAIEETRFTSDNSRPSASMNDSDGDADMESEKSTKDRGDALVGYHPKTRSTLASFDEYHVNYDLIVSLLETIASKPKFAGFSKAILVFLPGIAEIRRMNDLLSGHGPFFNGWYIHALHSSIAMDEQERAFAIPPPGYRKIVLATNIAETGVTIPDVTCVIDTGKHKEMRFDERRQLSRLIEVFISRANAKQRRGRAGRVQEGLCFHLFTKARHDTIMAAEQTPEILRLSLQDLVLRVKICKLGSVEQTLSEALDAPLVKNIRRAIDALADVKALTAAEELTPLGRQLAKLPLDVFLGKLILLGCVFKCLDATLTIAAILSSKSPFSSPMGARSQADQARLAFRKGDSDLLTVYNAYCSWRRTCSTSGASEQQFCRKNYLSQPNLMNIEELKAQLAIALADAGFLELREDEGISLNRIRSWSSRRTFVETPSRYNANSTDVIINTVICWSFYPKVLKRDGKGWRNIANNQSVSLHPTSVNKGIENPPKWLSFYHIMQSSNKFYNAHETSAVEPFALALACGEADFKMYAGVIVIDGNRIKFSVDDWKLMLAIKTLRQKLRQLTAQIFRDPGVQLSPQQQTWLGIWERIFAYHEEKMAGARK